jgi:single-stranded DNA-binding protein
MGGHNQVLISGHVETEVFVGTTGDGGEACSFSVTSGDSGQKITHVRVNAYGSVAEQCEREIKVGSYCVIVGELMNRPGKFGKLTEIRAKKVEFISDVDNDPPGESDAGQEDRKKDE